MASRAENAGRRPGRLGAEQGVPDGAAGPEHAGQGDDRRSSQAVGDEPAGEGRDGRGRGPAHPAEPEHAAANTGRVHDPPQPQVERAPEREAQPVDRRDGDHHGRDREHEDHDQGRGAKAADHAEAPRRARPEATREGTQQVGHEGRRPECREADGLQAAAPGDRGQQRGHDGQGQSDADGDEQVQGEVAPERAVARRDGRWPEHDVPQASPFGLRGQLSGSAWVSPPRSIRGSPRRVGPPSSRSRRFGQDQR